MSNISQELLHLGFCNLVQKLCMTFVLCKRESASSCLFFLFFLPFCFSLIRFSVTDFTSPMRFSLQSNQVYCGKENKDDEICFCLLFPIFLFPSHSKVIHGKFVSNISPEPLYLGFGNLVQMLCMTWRCGKENLHSPAYSSLYFFIFLSLQFSNIKDVSHTFLRDWEAYKAETRYTQTVGMDDVSCILESGCRCLFIPLFLHFSVSPIPKH